MTWLSHRSPSARFGFAVALALLGLQGAPALGADDDRRGIRLDELTQQEQQSEEFRRLAEEKRMESIARLTALLRDVGADDGDRKAEMMLRLADLYFEQGKADYAVEMERFFKEQEACFSGPNADDCDTTLKEEHPKSFEWYSKSIKLYEAVLKGYPRYARADQATFYLGMTHKEMKHEEDSLEAFKKLVKLYPTSGFVPDAYIFIGEYYFDHNEAFPALRAYLKAASYTEHERYGYAMYKLAWSYYNVEEYGNAIDTMKRVVSYSMEQSAAQNKTAVKLEEEALKDLVRFFADAGDMDGAYDYFNKLGRKELIHDMLKRLATLYFDQGKFDQSVSTYRRLIQENPNHADNPEYQSKIISCYRKMGQKDRVLDELRRLKDDYGKTSAWWRSNASNPDALKDADSTIETNLKTTATDFNKEARDLAKARHPRAADAFEKAVEAYKVYLTDYADDPKSYDAHHDFGELLWDLKRYPEAYEEYLKVVALDPKGQHSRYAAESAIFCAEEMVKKEGGGDITTSAIPAGVKIKDVQPIPLTDWEQKLIAAGKRYSDLYAGDSKIEIIIYKTAFLLYQRYHFAAAAEQFRSVISRWPDSPNAERSAKLILDVLEKREEWIPLRDTAKSFYDTKGLGSETFKKDMYGAYRNSRLLVVDEDYKKHSDCSRYADDLMAFFKEFQEYDKNADVLNAASVCYYSANRVADSMAVRHVLVEDERFGAKTKYYYDQVGALGYDYERLADFEQSAKYYDLLITVWDTERPKLIKARDAEKDAAKKKSTDETIAKMDVKAADALYSSATFRSGLGDWQGGIERYRRFINEFPNDERVMDIRLIIANTLEREGKFAESFDAFTSFYKVEAKDASPDVTFYARLHAGRSLISQGKTADALALYKESTDLYRKLKATGREPGAWSSFAAEMLYKLAEPDLETYFKLRIEGFYKKDPGVTGSALKAAVKKDDDATKASLTKKTGALVGLEGKYKEILEAGDGNWGMAALVALGRAYENMSTTLIGSPCPFYLTEDQCSIYKLTLEDKAYPQSEKAVEVYRMSLERAYELNLYNENTAFATRRLGELRPKEYPGLREELPKPGRAAEKSRSFELESSLK
jgi:tetratricopeptide (TPR) repeat protein